MEGGERRLLVVAGDEQGDFLHFFISFFEISGPFEQILMVVVESEKEKIS